MIRSLGTVVTRSLAAACLTLVCVPRPMEASRHDVLPQAAAAKPFAPASVGQAQPFLGEWTTAFEGPQGPFQLGIVLKAEAEKVTATVGSEMTGEIKVQEVTSDGSAIRLRYVFDMQGNQMTSVITLTPAGEKVRASLSVADGQFEVDGTATKKSK
jgi:hypothetical protein